MHPQPELNPIENVWAYLRANKLAISIFDSYDHIVRSAATVELLEYAKSVIYKAVGKSL